MELINTDKSNSVNSKDNNNSNNTDSKSNE